jgi:hypothetical protein
VTHAELELELPWYANGTSGARESAAVERELATCASCAAEVAELRALGATLRDIDAIAPAPSAYAFTDTLERIANEAEPTRATFFDRLVRWWANPRARGFGGGLAVVALAAFFLITHLARPLDGVGGSDSIPNADTVVGSGRVESFDKAAPAAESEPAPVEAPQAVLRAAPAAKDAASAHVRQLARDGTIGVLVPDVAAAIARSEKIAANNFGLVTALEDNAPSSPGDRHTATVTLSVPDDRFGGTIAQIAALGGVTARTVKTEDLTDSIVDTDSRLRNLRREETDLLKIMDRSGKVSDILDVEQQLSSTRESIEKLDGESQSMRRRVAYATIVIDFSDEKVATVAVPGPLPQISDAWHGALRLVLGFTLGLVANLLVLLAFAPYLIVVAAIAFFTIRFVRSRANRPY